MPYVNVPNDLSKIKTKIAFNLTKRQLICFGMGAAIGVPTYLLTRQAIGNTGALFAIALTLLSLILFIGGQMVGGIVFLVLAFLVSPFGVPTVAEWLADKLHSAKFALRDFIIG